MEFDLRLPGQEDSPPELSEEHSIIVHFLYGQEGLDPLYALEDELDKAINKAAVGEFDGDEVAVDGSDGYLYMYGPDGDKLFEVVRPLLLSAEWMNGASVQIWYGLPKTA